MVDILFGFILYVTPLVAIPLILRRSNNLKPIALTIFFSTPLIGEITYLILSRQHASTILTGIDFWKTVMSYYPMALFPLGLWGVLLAVGAITVLQAKARRQTFGATFLLVGGTLIGGMVGLIFMSLYSWATTLVHGDPSVNYMPYILSGVTAGVFSGFACGSFVLLTQTAAKGHSRPSQ